MLANADNYAYTIVGKLPSYNLNFVQLIDTWD